ncbi:MAG: pre-peptidase C-terminal domain-containing protein, partial [Cyanobacteriota bacterium]|nr:pre-peptidase C-terminal domain-containing protein [Cyanobacteriota bacterium]
MNILEAGSENISLILPKEELLELTQIPIGGVEPDVGNPSPLLEEPIESSLAVSVDETQSEEELAINDDTDILTGITEGEPNISQQESLPVINLKRRSSRKTDPGNNAKNALDLGNVGDDPVTYNDDIGIKSGTTTDKNDYYKFTLTGKENEVSVSVDGLKGNANVQLLDTNGKSVLFKSTEKGKKAETIDAELDKGGYYLRVFPQGNAKTEYDLSISADEILQDPDSKASGATDLGELGKKEKSRNGEIGFTQKGIRDNSDFYKFTLTEELNSVNVVLDGLRQNANIKLFDEDGKTILYQSREKGKSKEEIDEQLEAGTYYLKVEPQGGARTKYRLSFDSDKIGDRDGTLELAQEIAIGKKTKTFNDKIGFQEYGQRDQRDYYQFTLKKDSKVNITLDGLNRNADLDLLDKRGSLLFSSSEKGKKADEITSILEPGDYHILVKPSGSARTKYNLRIDADPNVKDPDGQVPGNKLGKLRKKEIKRNDKIGFQESVIDANDYWNFELTKETDLTLQLDGLKQNADLELYDSDGTTLLYESKNKGRASEEINEVLDPGTYYARVRKVGSNKTEYSLSLLGETDFKEKDDKIPGSTALGEIGEEPATKFEQVGLTKGSYKDFQDYYNFTLTEKSQVNIVLDGLSGNGKLELLDTNKKTLLDKSDRPKRQNESIDTVLDKGTYYVKVAPGGNGGGKTKYNLQVSADPGEDDYGTPETAKQLGNLDEQEDAIVEANNVGFTEGFQRDLVDYYSFELTEQAKVNLTLDKLKQGNANLELLSGNGETVLDRSENSRKKRESITQELEVGTYYARVFPVGTARTDYDLSLQTNKPPIVEPPIEDVKVNEDAANKEIDLSPHFTDSDSELTYEVASNSDEDLVTSTLRGDKLTLDFLDDKFGNADIEVKATADDGQSVSDTFTVDVTAVDDPPEVTPKGDFSVEEDAINTEIDLSTIFSDKDSALTWTVPTSSNPDLVSATVEGNNLILDYLDNQFGAAEITVGAESNGQSVSDTFT